MSRKSFAVFALGRPTPLLVQAEPRCQSVTFHNLLLQPRMYKASKGGMHEKWLCSGSEGSPH